ncbi:MAG: LytTR family DNA-binding domain-containing protein [Paracoccaceae bacterium]
MTGLGTRLVRAFGSPVPYVSWLGLSLALAVSGPFGTYLNCGFFGRLICFATLVGVAMIWGVALRAVVQHLLPQASYWSAVGIAIFVSALALPVPLAGLAPRVTHFPPSLVPPTSELAFLILVMGYAAAAARWTLSRELRAESVGKAGPLEIVPRLLLRLAPSLRGTLIRVSGRDHYVDIVTDKGQAAVLLRLSDAMREIEGVDGLQVHRSHWVAANAVRGSEAAADRRFLILSDGSKVPVSRNYLPAVEQRGLLQRNSGTAVATVPVSTASAPAGNSRERAGSRADSPPV